jgi:toxin ParE1/3/4
VTRRAELTELAASDIDVIASYTSSTWGPAQEEAYLGALESALERLARRPKIGAPRSDLRAGLRGFAVGSHVIFYVETDYGIAVLRILHKRQDPSHNL